MFIFKYECCNSMLLMQNLAFSIADKLSAASIDHKQEPTGPCQQIICQKFNLVFSEGTSRTNYRLHLTSSFFLHVYNRNAGSFIEASAHFFSIYINETFIRYGRVLTGSRYSQSGFIELIEKMIVLLLSPCACSMYI